MEKLTEKQKQVHEFIKGFCSSNGFNPTIREIATNFKVNVNAANKHLKALAAKGYVTHTPKLSRGTNLASGSRLAAVPLLGSVHAGMPSLAIEEPDQYVNIDEVVVKGSKCFALKVKGDSMINAGINDGDVVVVRQQPSAQHGEIVVAMIDGEATVKKLHRKDGETLLIPENPAYQPIKADNIIILGKVVFLMRNI